MILLEKAKAIPQIKRVTINKGRIKRSREIPADLIAINSKFSPRLPKVIIDERRIANGSARGTSTAAW